MLAGLLVVLSDCGGGDASVKTTPVSGTVTLDGKPKEGLLVSFEPTGGTGLSKEGWSASSGITDAQGRYRLETPTGQSGAVVGTHRVTIAEAPKAEVINVSSEGAAPPKVRSKPVIPAKYNTQSNLTFDVPEGGTSDANFPLTSK